MDPLDLPSSSPYAASGIVDPLIEWGAAAASLPGQPVSGDGYVVERHGEAVLVAVMDGLGHGDEAAAASNLAAGVIRAHASDDLASLFARCHHALAKSRGVVMSAVQFDARNHTLTWMGVGNVDGYVSRANPGTGPARESILSLGGIVGYHLPALRPSSIPIARGDVLVLATDGIRSGFMDGCTLSDEPRRIADHIFRQHWRKTDDAQVFVARYLGGGV